METLELEVSLNSKQYYHFNLYHCYHSLSGFVSIFLGLLCIVYAVVFREQFGMAKAVAFIILGIIVLIYNPVSLFLSTKRRFLANPVMKNPVIYRFSKTGILLKQGEVEEEMQWENIRKIIKTKESMIFYLTKYHANIIPLEEMDGHYKDVCAFLEKYADKNVIKFRMEH